MTGGLKKKFVIYTAYLIISISLVYIIFFISETNKLVKKEIISGGSILARNLAHSSELGIASEDSIFLKPFLDGIINEEDVVLAAIYDHEGHIIISRKKEQIEDRMPVDVFNDIVTKEKDLQKISYSENGEKIYDFFSPVFVSDILSVNSFNRRELSGFVRVGLSLEKINQKNKEAIFKGFGIIFLMLAIGFIVVFILVDKIIKPIKELIKGTEFVSHGDLDYKIKIDTNDEIKELADSFNEMIISLKKARDELQEAKDILEIKVRARTRRLKELTENLEKEVKEKADELSRKIGELEDFNELAVGRELRMIELKKEIENLKREKGRERKKDEKPESVNCWDFWDCPENVRKRCPAFQTNSGRECWLISSGHCPRSKERGFEDCKDCDWYKKLNF